jgi:putative addiction module component (TIGR02574 family)
MSVNLDEIRQMSVDERLKLINDVWETLIEDEGTLPLSEAQGRELNRRLAEHRADPGIGTPWEEVRRKRGSTIGFDARRLNR